MDEDAYFTNPIWEQFATPRTCFPGYLPTVWRTDGRFKLTGRGEASYAHGNVASGQFFDTLGLRAMLSRTFNASDTRRPHERSNTARAAESDKSARIRPRLGIPSVHLTFMRRSL